MDPERLRYLFDLLDARRQPRAGVVIDLDAERDKRRRRHAVGGSIPNTATWCGGSYGRSLIAAVVQPTGDRPNKLW